LNAHACVLFDLPLLRCYVASRRHGPPSDLPVHLVTSSNSTLSRCIHIVRLYVHRPSMIHSIFSRQLAALLSNIGFSQHERRSATFRLAISQHPSDPGVDSENTGKGNTEDIPDCSARIAPRDGRAETAATDGDLHHRSRHTQVIACERTQRK
jgi:hypothetical protein